MPAYSNPFTYLPIDVCGDVSLPDFPVIQDCVSYPQLRSEVGGLLIRPTAAASPPVSWSSFSAWSSHIDNTDPDEVHYLVGRGGFSQTAKTEVNLAGGRVDENRERTQRLAFQVLNMDTGHANFGRELQANKKDFAFWVYTIGGRVIGGSSGMRPIFTDAEFTFAQGKDSRESMLITIDTEFLQFPLW